MTTLSAIHRGVVYVTIAMLTQAVADLGSAFNGDKVSLCKFWIQVTLAGLITWKAFLDQGVSEIKK